MAQKGEEKYYKVILPSGKSPTKEFDYSKYLPEGDTPGQWLPAIEQAQLESAGYYVSKHWNMWFEEGARVYLVECRNLVSRGDKQTAVEKQLCCASLRFLKDVTDECIKMLCADNVGKFNTGAKNTGNRNQGQANSGDFNIGSRNCGNLNAGDFNTGDQNTGLDNVGDNNQGTANVGCRNIGHSNTGSDNIGSYNSGSHNRGHGNAGSFNVGNFNVGKWNIGNYQSGFFNTDEPQIRMFNKPVHLKQSSVVLPKWLYAGNLKSAFESADLNSVKAVLALPNFDFDIFFEITAISKADFEKKLDTSL